MENQKIGWASTAFTDQVKLGRDAHHIAGTVTLAWEGIDLALQSIIGKHGVNALFRRTMEITALTYPWLVTTSDYKRSAMDLESLKKILLEQDSIHFAAASDFMLKQFHDILTELIGLSLTERLLRPVLDPLLNRTATTDI